MQPGSPIQQEPETNETPSSVAQEVKQLEPYIIEHTKKSQKRNISIPIVIGLLVILCIAVASMGFWTYKLNTNLAETKQQLATLQGEEAKLQSDYTKIKNENNKLTSDLAQLKVDIEKSNKDLTTAKADLKQSKEQNKKLQDKLTTASKNSEILYLLATMNNAKDILKLDDMINETNDKELLSQWENFTSSPSAKNSADFLLYMISSIRDILKD